MKFHNRDKFIAGILSCVFIGKMSLQKGLQEWQ